MKCPFTPGACLGRECPGWSLGGCFLQLFLQKMDNISLKLDTLCNLSSITVSAYAAATKSKQAGPETPAGSDLASEIKANEQPTLWAMAEATPGPEKTDTRLLKEAPLCEVLESTLSGIEHRVPFRAGHVPETASVAQQQDRTKPDVAHVDVSKGIPFEAESELTIPARGFLPGFPAKVSEIMFTDEAAEAETGEDPEPAQGIEAQELSLEVPAIEKLATEIIDELTVNERVLLAAQPTNGSGTTGVPYDGITPEFYDGSSSEEPNDVSAKPTPDSTLDNVVVAEGELSVSSGPELQEQPAAKTGAGALSVEKLIDDITAQESDRGPVPEDRLSAEEAIDLTTGSTVAQETTGELAIVAQKVEAAAAAQRPAIEEDPEPEPAQVTDSSAVDVSSLESVPSAAGIEVSVEEIQQPVDEVSPATDPASWVPVDLVEARGEAVLGIDFGSVLSKVALKPDGTSPAMAIPLALTAYDILHKAGLMSHFESRNEYVEESLIYFDPNEFVFCGSLAKKLSQEAAESGSGRPAIQNLKTFLVRGGANLQIHNDFFPASESLDSQSVLAIYLAYLLRLTRHYLDKRASKIAVDLDTTIRAFSIPTWIEDRYREDVKRLFRGAAAYAFCLERWLKDDLVKGVRLPDLRKALDEARQYKAKVEENLTGAIMTESVAAGNSRVLGLTNERVRPLTVLVVNVGAGFTDFALFTVSYPEARDAKLAAQVAFKGGVGTGLGVWDNALKTLLFNRVREVPAARKKVNEFRLFKTRLELQVKNIKEALMSSEEAIPVDVSPVLPEPVFIERSELESSLPVKAALFGIRDGLRMYIKEAIKAVGMHRFDPGFTEILITGGGAYLPSVVDCVREAVATLGPAYPSKVRSDYASALYASIPNIGALYPLLAVALGSTEKEYPDEQATAAPSAPTPTLGSASQNRVAAGAARGINKFRLG
jgi:hypothetical protein